MKKGAKRGTDAQELLRTHLRELGITTEMEYQFHPERKWRFDLVSLEHRLAFECDGRSGRGFHGSAYLSKKQKERNARLGRPDITPVEDGYDKQNAAQLMGFRILRFTNRQILNGDALSWLKNNL